MNTSKPWDHLPNVKHIDSIIASWNQHRDIWVSALRKWCNLIGFELRDQAIYEARAKCEELGRLGIWRDSKILHTGGTVLALIAYDDCAHYLEYTSQELTTIALLGVAPAIMLLLAVIAFEEIAKLKVTA